MSGKLTKVQREWPFKPGDWVSNDADRIAKVKDVYGDEDEVLLDLIVFDLSGERVGRASPACGGPRTFEPACAADGWERVPEPRFPILPVWVPQADGSAVMRPWAGDRLPPAKWVRPRRKRRSTSIIPDNRMKAALQAIADGHNDPRAVARAALLTDTQQGAET